MEQKDFWRSTIAVLLSMAVVFVWMNYFTPKEVAPGAPPSGKTEVAPGAPKKEEAKPALGVPPPPAAPAPSLVGDPSFPPVTLKNDQFEITFSPRGGRIMSWKLLSFPKIPTKPEEGAFDLFSPEARKVNRHPLILLTGNQQLDQKINEAACVVDQTPPTAAELNARQLPAGTQRVSFKWADGEGLALRKDFFLPQEELMLARIEWSLTKNGQPVPGAAIWWGPGIGFPVNGDKADQYNFRGQIQIAAGPKIQTFQPKSNHEDVLFNGANAPRWQAISGAHFSVALVPVQPANTALRALPGFTDNEPNLGLATEAQQLTIFAGPRSDRLLKKVDLKLGTDLSRLVDWGWFAVIAYPLYLSLEFFKSQTGNWGLAIVIVTIIIRLLFFPLTQNSQIKMRKNQQDMARVQPKIHKLKEKYKGLRDMENRRKMQEEMMEIYKREGINPMTGITGCLPLLLQMPVLFGMYKVLQVATELRGAPFFGWIQDLSARDPYYITPVVMGVTMLVQQLMSMTKTEDPQMRSQQRMMLFMPIIFTWMFLKFPSGLVVYWLVNNILSIGQQFLVNKQAAKLFKTAPAK